MTTLTTVQPISKLYKRCAWGKHDVCPGSFENYSICSCQCHAGVSDMRAAEVVAEAVAIVAPTRIVVPQISNADTAKMLGTTPLGTPRKAAPKVKASGLSTKTDKFAKWANAIVAKNARLEAAWQAVKDAKGLVLTEGVPQSVFAPLSDNGTHHCPRKTGETYCEACIGKGRHEIGAGYRNA